MKFRKHYPTEALQPYVRHLWLFTLEQEDIPYLQDFFPYGSHEVVFYLENPPQMYYHDGSPAFFQEQFSYSGQFTKPFTLHFSKPCRCLGISLHPWAGKLLFDIPAYHCTDAMIPLHTIDAQSSITERLVHSSDDTTLFSLCEEYLQQRLCHKECDPVAMRLACGILQTPTAASVQTNLAAIGLGSRRIEQRFAEAVGLSMRDFRCKVRFHKAVQLLQKKASHNNASPMLTQIGLASGYYDQSHFIREFKAYSGVSPRIFRQQHSELRSFFHSLLGNQP